VGAVQKLATVVIVGLVATATVLVLYLADENNRIKAEEANQQEAAIERATANYLSLCLPCHGPAGEGNTVPGEYAKGRLGAPLGGNTAQTLVNQQGIQANGSPVPGGVGARATVISTTIHNGRPGTKMPAWGEANGGPLNDAQIEELVTMIQHVDWNEVYNQAIKANGGVYPTPDPANAPASPTAAGSPTAAPSGTPTGNTVEVDMVDIAFQPTEITIPANTDVAVTLVNKGASQHTFNIDALKVATGNVDPGATKTVTINAPAGEYEYYCAIPGHKEAGMVGKLIVK
jgi:plastocyanin